MAITEKDVHGAADALLLEGERPTIERVRLKLGRGSPNTITGFLNTWFMGLGSRLASEHPADIPEPVFTAARTLWQSAQAAAHAQIQTDQVAQREQLDRDRGALASRAKALEAEAARLAAREADLELAVTSLRDQLAAAVEQARALTVQRDAAEAQQGQAHAAAQAKQEEVEALREARARDHAQQAARLAQAQERHAAQERRWLTELDVERQHAKGLQVELARVRQAVDSARAETLAAQADCARMAEERRAAEREAAALRAELDANRVRMQAVEEGAEAAAHAAGRRETERGEQLAHLTAQLAAKEKQLDSLLATLARRGGARRANPTAEP